MKRGKIREKGAIFQKNPLSFGLFKQILPSSYSFVALGWLLCNCSASKLPSEAPSREATPSVVPDSPNAPHSVITSEAAQSAELPDASKAARSVEAEQDETFAVGDWTVSLVSGSDPCAIVAVRGTESVELSTELGGPCFPARDFKGSPKVVKYPKLNASVAIFVGTPVAPRAEYGIKCEDSYRASRIQGLLAGQAGLSLAKSSQYSPRCKFARLNEADYWLVSHPQE